MNRFKRILLPVIVLVVGIIVGVALIATGPKVERRQPPQQLPVVETLIVQPQDYQVVVNSQGTVTPRTQSTLIPEVAGFSTPCSLRIVSKNSDSSCSRM